MDQFIRINDRFLPLHAISFIDDDGGEMRIVVRDQRDASTELRLEGSEAASLRAWLEERTALSVGSQSELHDTGIRMDD